MGDPLEPGDDDVPENLPKLAEEYEGGVTCDITDERDLEIYDQENQDAWLKSDNYVKID